VWWYVSGIPATLAEQKDCEYKARLGHSETSSQKKKEKKKKTPVTEIDSPQSNIYEWNK
jgi:hypothetical protein